MFQLRLRGLIWLLLELAVTGLCINKILLSTAMPSCQSQSEQR